MRPPNEGGRPLVRGQDGGPTNEPVAGKLTDSVHAVADVPHPLPAAPQCVTCGHDPVAALHDRLDAQQESWRAGWRACAERAYHARLADFAAGWQRGLQAGAERGTAA